MTTKSTAGRNITIASAVIISLLGVLIFVLGMFQVQARAASSSSKEAVTEVQRHELESAKVEARQDETLQSIKDSLTQNRRDHQQINSKLDKIIDMHLK